MVIYTEQENERALSIITELIERGESHLSEEEGQLLDSLAVLVEGFPDRVYAIPKGEPHKMLACLLEEEGMKPTTCGPCFLKAACRKSSAASAPSARRRSRN
ncbi:MAG TPA: hypothetical protein VGZ73_09490 [Bryobacteraceae bacterium]|nr:hypothetical protein [Bryobacteraceae bacterium]